MPKIRFTDTTSGAKQDADADLPIDAKPYGGSGATVRPKVFRTASAAVVIPPQVNTLPTIGGGPEVSSVLTLSIDFDGGVSYGYRWLLDGVLSGSSATYTIQSGDQGKTITAEAQAIGAGVSSAWYTAINSVFVPFVTLAVVDPDEWETYEAVADVDTRKMYARVNDTPTSLYEFAFYRGSNPDGDLATLGAMTNQGAYYDATSSGQAALGTPEARTRQYIRIAERLISDPTTKRWVSGVKFYDASSTPTAPVVAISQGTGVGEILINITTVADPSGRAVTAYQYRVDGGSWVALSGLGIGPRSITGFTPLSTYSIEVRAVNANGNGAATAAQTTLAGDPPAPPPAVTNLVFNSQQIVMDGSYTVVTHIDGTKCIVVPSGSVTLTGKTPAIIPTLGAVRNGIVKNPQRRVQAFDTRMGQINMAALASLPLTLTAGDVLLSAVSMPEGSVAAGRSGFVDSYDMVYVATSAPNPLSIGPAAIGWPGRSSLTVPAVVDYLAKAALMPVTYGVTGYVYKTEAQIDRALRFNPGYALSWQTFGGGGDPSYEAAHPHNWASPTPTTTSTVANYAVTMSDDLNTLLWHLAAPLANVPLAVKARIMMWLHSYAFQCEQTWEGNATEPNVDGGHGQQHHGPFGLMYWMNGNDAGLDALRTRYSGNWRQYFRFTEDMLPEWFQPWGDPDDFTSMYDLPYPATMFRRKILSVDSVAKTIGYMPLAAYGPGQARGASTKQRLFGLYVTRESDGASARINGPTGDAEKGTDLALTAKTIQVETWPTPGFAVDDVFTFSAPWASFAVGDVEWRINPGANIYNPCVVQAYRELIRTMSPLAFMRVLGLHRTDWQEAWEYCLKSVTPNYPTATDNWDAAFPVGGFFDSLWTAHSTAILAVSQPNIP